jgi:3HB-oligomer hydrolase 3HBOH
MLFSHNFRRTTMRPAHWLLASLLVSLPTAAQSPRCDAVLAALAGRLIHATCTESTDLTTANPATTPANNSIPAQPPFPAPPPFAFTPQTDRGVISPNPPHRTPIAKAVPGMQINARVAGDLTGQARFLLRLPKDWNGKLVVAGASGTRSEFNGDFAWSDYVVQKGYAYASQNKGILNFFVTLPDKAFVPAGSPFDPLACRVRPEGPLAALFVHFYDLDPEKPFTEWQSRIAQAARIARDGLKAHYRRSPRHTYAVGTSNGGYQVRRAVEEAPDLFDGGVDWEGTLVDSSEHNLLATLPAGIKNFLAYRAGGFDGNGAAAQAMIAAGYPPDIVIRDGNTNAVTDSLWQRYYTEFWEVTQCQWQKRLDPGYDTYGQGAGNYGYESRVSVSEVAANLAAFENTGKIKVPLITIAGTMDGLLPIIHHGRAYAEKVVASRKGNNARRHAQYRLYEVQNGNHIETYKDIFPQLEFIQPHAQRAFDLLVDHVENGAALPPDQCIPRPRPPPELPESRIQSQPAHPGRCASLFVP